MKSHYFWIILTVILVIVAFLTMALSANADCNPADVGTSGNDSIICDTSYQPGGTQDVQGLGGDDVIVVDSGVSAFVDVSGDNTGAGVGTGNDTIVNSGTINGNLIGDSDMGDGTGNDAIVNNGYADSLVGDTSNGVGSGSDVLVNNGTVVNMNGDSIFNSGSGSDSLVNNGTTNEMFGDTTFGDGSGNDTLVNNGNVVEDVYADTYSGTGSGNDTVINNGVVAGNVFGDSELGSGTGNDNITNGGTINGSIYAGGGDDTVTIVGSGSVGGVIDGGADYDVLNFNFTSSDPEELLAIAQQIAAANPAGGTLTIRGIVYTWQNFEQLSSLLLSLIRINGVADPFAVFCTFGGGIDVYAIVGDDGVLSLTISAQALSNAIARAQEIGTFVRVDSSATSTVYVFPSGEIQVNAPTGYDYAFDYRVRCGELPLPGAVVEEEVELDSFVIINRPR